MAQLVGGQPHDLAGRPAGVHIRACALISRRASSQRFRDPIEDLLGNGSQEYFFNAPPAMCPDNDQVDLFLEDYCLQFLPDEAAADDECMV